MAAPIESQIFYPPTPTGLFLYRYIWYGYFINLPLLLHFMSKKNKSRFFIKNIFSIVIVLGLLVVIISLMVWEPTPDQEPVVTAVAAKQDVVATVEVDGIVTELEIDGAIRQVIESEVDEFEVVELDADNTITVYVEAVDETYEAELRIVGDEPRVTQGASYYEIVIELVEDGIEPLRLGMHGEITIEVERSDDVLAVPAKAITEDGDQRYYVQHSTDIKDDTFERVEVELGVEGDEYVEIKDGLRVGDVVVVE